MLYLRAALAEFAPCFLNVRNAIGSVSLDADNFESFFTFENRFVDHNYFPSAARLSSAISNFFICKKAFVTLANFSESEDRNISSIIVGTTCQDSPNLSFSHPHCSLAGTAESFPQ